LRQPSTISTQPKRQRPLLDVPGVAAYLTISVRPVRRLVAERRVPHHKVGHLVRFDPDEIDAWLANNHRGPDGHRRPA
jgi:excisionase family DNA binding protein